MLITNEPVLLDMWRSVYRWVVNITTDCEHFLRIKITNTEPVWKLWVFLTGWKYRHLNSIPAEMKCKEFLGCVINL
jgi:uncharacterized protein involved in tolerance to divalent cations